MGKTAFNPLSRWRGRVGGQVYKVVNGQQVVVPYSGASNKSNTIAQQAVRARFALAGKLSKITPPEILAGLKGSKTDRRSEFVRGIVKRSVLTTIENGIQASIDAPNVIFSKGEVAAVDLSSLTIDSNGLISGTVTGINEKIDALLVIGVVSNATDYTNAVYEIVPVSDGEANVSLSAETGAGRNVTVQLYYVPLWVTETAQSFLSSSEYDQLGTGNDEYVLNMLINSVEGAFTWGQSQYVKALSFQG